MKVVLDANILISALLGSKITIEIITSGKTDIFAPTKIITEILKYRELISYRKAYSPEEFDILLNSLLKFVHVVDPEVYDSYLAKAIESIGKRDINDIEYIACSLAIDADHIWTNDKDFTCQNLVKVKTTKDLFE